MRSAATMIQKHIRRIQAVKRFKKIKAATLVAQRGLTTFSLTLFFLLLTFF